MNKDMMLRVAEAIEAEPERFQMDVWFTPAERNICGTVGCIAGTAVALAKDLTYDDAVEHNDCDGQSAQINFVIEGGALLGLTLGQATNLFVGTYWWADVLGRLGYDLSPPECCPCGNEGCTARVSSFAMRQVTHKHAADVLRGLVEGRIEWDEGGTITAVHKPDEAA